MKMIVSVIGLLAVIVTPVYAVESAGGGRRYVIDNSVFRSA